MELTDVQRIDMQEDLGITDDELVFTDAALDRLYTRATGSYELAVYYGYRQLLADANKFHNYAAGLAREDLSQVRANLKDSMLQWKNEAAGTVTQVLNVGMVTRPPSDPEYPAGDFPNGFDR